MFRRKLLGSTKTKKLTVARLPVPFKARSGCKTRSWLTIYFNETSFSC